MKAFSVSLLVCSLACGQLALAAPITLVSGTNTVLTGQINNADKDVNNINAANALANGRAIPKDLQTIVEGFEKGTSSIQSVAKTTNAGEVNAILNSYNGVTQGLTQLDSDLISKKTDLQTVARQGSAIEDNLSDLLDAFAAYSAQISRIVATETAQDSVSTSTAQAYQAISNARDEYKTETVPELPK